MTKNYEKLLPIGSVVHIKGANKNMMIIGIVVTNNDVEYDYFAVLYPEGYVDNKLTFLFNHEDIDKVLYVGYINSELQLLVKQLVEKKKA
ncbi:MAG: DUF4176 domain-containing protein [Lachnospiraceae bacterium]|nr:DUF4176 domain-containing protein [Lachnospiraceae bacterium]